MKFNWCFIMVGSWGFLVVSVCSMSLIVLIFSFVVKGGWLVLNDFIWMVRLGMICSLFIMEVS